MKDLSYTDINHEVMRGHGPAGKALSVFRGFLLSWHRVRRLLLGLSDSTGMGVERNQASDGLGHLFGQFCFLGRYRPFRHPDLGHSLFIPGPWRTAIARSAEAMTVFAVMIAGLFPFIHLGRVWIVYWILPYPNQRNLWPNFQSPLVFDVIAISTYLLVSILFWYTGLIPDLAVVETIPGLRHKIYGFFSLGWIGSHHQWRHHGGAYLFFAALATPLVISVHSVVSWDFALSIVPGWHSTIFAPYFVAGAIHSGLAMVLILLIPLRQDLPV